MTRPLVHPSLTTRLRPSFFDATVTIQRATAASSGTAFSRGTAPDSYANLANHVDLPCRLWPAGSAEQWESDKTVELSQFIALVSGDYRTIVPLDNAIIGGVTYQVVGVEPDSAGVTTGLRLERRVP